MLYVPFILVQGACYKARHFIYFFSSSSLLSLFAHLHSASPMAKKGCFTSNSALPPLCAMRRKGSLLAKGSQLSQGERAPFFLELPYKGRCPSSFFFFGSTLLACHWQKRKRKWRKKEVAIPKKKKRDDEMEGGERGGMSEKFFLLPFCIRSEEKRTGCKVLYRYE